MKTVLYREAFKLLSRLARIAQAIYAASLALKILAIPLVCKKAMLALHHKKGQA